MNNCDCNQGRLPCTCKPVPAGFASGRDEDNMVLLDKRDLFDAVRGAIKEAMLGSGSYADDGEVFGMATDAATDALRELVSKGAVPPAGDVEVLCIMQRGNHYDGKTGAWQFLPVKAVSPFGGNEYVELVDRAHVTRLTAELGKVNAFIDVLREQNEEFGQLIELQQSELTKARELLVEIKDYDISHGAQQAIETYLASQSAPAAKGGE